MLFVKLMLLICMTHHAHAFFCFVLFVGEITSKKKDLGLMLLFFCVHVTDWMMCACSDWMSCRRSLLAIAPGCIYKGEEVHVFPV